MTAAQKLIIPTSQSEKDGLYAVSVTNSMDGSEYTAWVGERDWATAKADLMKRVGFISDHVQVPGPKILVAIYYRPMKTSGGIINPGAKEEDSHQGKIGLVLKMGPLAFAEDSNHAWEGVSPKVGDWVQFRVGDTAPWRMGRDSKLPHLRYVEDVNVLAIWDRPDLVW